jgi:putative exosortase-associated protein (TIGR04073 family)
MPKRRHLRIFTMGIITIALAVANATADPSRPDVQSDVLVESQMGRQVQQGLAGVTLGFLEVPGTIVEKTRENGPIVGLALGLTQGVGRFVTRELVGVYQIISAPFGIENATQDPEFPWQRFGSGGPIEIADPLEQEATELGWIRGIQVKRSPGALRATFPADLLFASGSAQIAAGAEPRLLGLAETLLRHPDTQIEVQGHSDSTGTPEFNVELSKRRAAAVREFLMANGLDGNRIQTAGFGAARPIASNGSGQGRQANRRVEVELTKSVAALD